MAGKAPNFVLIQIGAESGGGTAGKPERISTAQTTPCAMAARPQTSEVIETEVSEALIHFELGVKLDAFDRAVDA
ncbi:hypothetical protein [Bradyrhizobium yuanmingense]|uniref:hypothetical protein n=1 Tax=Bradyrhizobium yuanmingense TaxID=108015 RepID=UPI001FD38E3F|nr:hypothetical protein [Bradyrhizobium yuanmingense]